MEEILPAARLLSQATAVTPSDYERAKAVFLEHVKTLGAAAEQLSKQVILSPCIPNSTGPVTIPADLWIFSLIPNSIAPSPLLIKSHVCCGGASSMHKCRRHSRYY